MRQTPPGAAHIGTWRPPVQLGPLRLLVNTGDAEHISPRPLDRDEQRPPVRR